MNCQMNELKYCLHCGKPYFQLFWLSKHLLKKHKIDRAAKLENEGIDWSYDRPEPSIDSDKRGKKNERNRD